MATIVTRLIKDGNSTSVRLSKPVLAMSGLSGTVQLDVRQGQIIIRAGTKPREGWQEQIARVVATNPMAGQHDKELEDWETTVGDGIDEAR